MSVTDQATLLFISDPGLLSLFRSLSISGYLQLRMFVTGQVTHFSRNFLRTCSVTDQVTQQSTSHVVWLAKSLSILWGFPLGHVCD